MSEDVVLDASVMVALLTSTAAVEPIASRLRGHIVHVPAHFDAEVLSALGRLHRAGLIPTEEVSSGLAQLARAPYERHPLAPLLAAAWDHRANVRLVDALYLALSDAFGAPLLTLDRGLAGATARGELIPV
jgi:predicted nucleic acid-binding protein